MKHRNLLTPTNRITSNTLAFDKKLILALVCFAATTFGYAQSVSSIITDYNGYWKSSATAINPVKPVSSHNLLAFTYNNVQYSTGVNDQLLSNQGESFVPGDFWSLPVAGFTGAVSSNTKIGVGEMYDGVHNGASNPSPVNNIALYLTDGIKGLNIGTGIANLPAGVISFNVNTINPMNIGDGIPDILVTQIADPSGSTDSYSYVDALGNIVGHKKDIVFTSITPVANWTADFYEAATNPLTLTGGYTNTDRQMRLWAADLSDFGITAANYLSVKKFAINLSGSSDVAFVGYNNKTFNISTVLPVTLSGFSGKTVNQKTQLIWTTMSEENTAAFTIERSADNRTFSAITTINATGNSTAAKQYQATDNHPVAGVNYYRLKMIDLDGSFTYSPVIMIQVSAAANLANLYPNPTSGDILFSHPVAKDARIVIYNANGIAMLNASPAGNTHQTKLDLHALATGIYYAVWQSETGKISLRLLKK